MTSVWRNLKNIFSRPLFTIIFSPNRFRFEGTNDGCFTALQRVKTGLGNKTTPEHLIQHKSNKLTLGLGFYLGFSYIDGRVNAYCLQYYSVTLSLVVKIVTEVRYLPPTIKDLFFSFHIQTKVIYQYTFQMNLLLLLLLGRPKISAMLLKVFSKFHRQNSSFLHCQTNELINIKSEKKALKSSFGAEIGQLIVSVYSTWDINTTLIQTYVQLWPLITNDC